jgi:uncharacterized membrane protein YgdD (TMEM256/DUF423 family)
MACNYLMINGGTAPTRGPRNPDEADLVGTVALLAISQHPVHAKRWVVPLIIAGTTMFSGSIFGLLLYRQQLGRFIGPITPLGGLLMIGGYASLLF